MTLRYDPRRILSNWKIGNIVSIRKLEAGVVNQNWLVRTSSGQYILRRVVFETPHELRFELGYLRYLKARGFSYEIPFAISTITGGLFVFFRNAISWLYQYIEGEFKTRLGKTEIRQVARMMATYHTLIEKSELDNGKSRGDLFREKLISRELRNFQAKLSRKAVLKTTDRVFLREANKLLPLLERLEPKHETLSRLSKYPLHRDITPDNLVWRKNRLVGLIDFENVGRYSEPLIKDISVFFQYACRENLHLDVDLIGYFLHEYRKYHSLAEGEIKLIPNLVVAGFIEDFSYAYWMINFDPERARSYRLRLYSKLARSICNTSRLVTERILAG